MLKVVQLQKSQSEKWYDYKNFSLKMVQLQKLGLKVVQLQKSQAKSGTITKFSD